ncbi:MAG TPA: phosphate ABC transporter substrate-binding protein PstS [Candidatus Hydrothermia bacterium]|nr:phosphate ABC transporter substrate-binding protein PstS [Candidatus Hydrothermia bacterium]
MKKTLMILLGLLLAPIPAVTAELTGAGATFPQPLYSKMFDVYYKTRGVKVNYQGIGSGGGIQQLIAKTVEFAASDAPMTTSEGEKAGSEILHIPTCLGAVVITYNLKGNPELKLTSDMIADIYLGKIKYWNDPRIQKLNPDVKLPKLVITPVYRADASGTTFIFTDYLSKAVPEWKEKMGVGKSLNWPIGVGGKGNPGVTSMVQQIEGSVGYVELTYALQNKLPTALINNKAGKFIKPNAESASKAVGKNVPPHMKVSITDTDSPDGYPISSFTWILVYRDLSYLKDVNKAKELYNLLWWIIHEGQEFATPMNYAPLPQSIISQLENNLKRLIFGNQPLWKI